MIALFIPVGWETLGGLAFASSLGGLCGGTAVLLPTKLGGASFRVKNNVRVKHR